MRSDKGYCLIFDGRSLGLRTRSADPLAGSSDDQVHFTRVLVLRFLVTSPQNARPLTASAVVAAQLVERFFRVLPVVP